MKTILFAILVLVFFTSFALCANDVIFSQGPSHNERGGAATLASDDVEVEFLDSEQEETLLQQAEPATVATVQEAPIQAAQNKTKTSKKPRKDSKSRKSKPVKGGKSKFAKHHYTDEDEETETMRWRRHFASVGRSVSRGFSRASSGVRSAARSSSSGFRRAASSARSYVRSIGGSVRSIRGGFRRSAGRIRSFARSAVKRSREDFNNFAARATRTFHKANKDFDKTFGGKTPAQLDSEIQATGSAPAGML